ncbi:MAG: hypothetical protein AAGF97_16550, partial [Planctomycetota bacterium]
WWLGVSNFTYVLLPEENPAAAERALESALVDFSERRIPEEQRTAELHIDAESPLAQLTLQTVNQLERLAPFGAGNPRPLLCATGVQLAEPPRTMGSGDRHLAARFKQENVRLRAVAFGHGDWAESLSQVSGPLDIAYRPVINEFRGQRSVELHLADWRPTGARD